MKGALKRLALTSRRSPGKPGNEDVHPSTAADGENNDAVTPGDHTHEAVSPAPLSSLQTAIIKLSQGATPYPIADLPKDRADPLWNDIRQEYDLTLPEFGALKNAVDTPDGLTEEIEVSHEGKVDIFQKEPVDDPVVAVPNSGDANTETAVERNAVTSDAHSQGDQAEVNVTNDNTGGEPIDPEDEVVQAVSEAELEDLDAMLANMDVEKDLTGWASFRHSMSRRGKQKKVVEAINAAASPKPSLPSTTEEDEEASPPDDDEDDLEVEEIEKYSNRLSREEVYSLKYRPSKEEQKELLDLEKQLGIKTFSFFSAPTVNEVAWNQLVHPDPNSPSSILLKRGPVLFKSSSPSSPAKAEDKEHEAELIVLTHGLVVAQTVQPPSNSAKNPSPRRVAVTRKFERALPLQSLVYVAPDSDEDCAFNIVVRSADHPGGHEKLCFVAGSLKQQAAWLKALETAVVNHFMSDNDVRKDLGWQYKFVHKPGFTRSVLGVEDDLLVPEGGSLNELDSYNGYAPLHYAVRLQHEQIVQSLLEEKADPNLPDADGRTPGVHAVHDEVPEPILLWLKKYGCKDIDKAKREKAELFERVTATQCEREERREMEQEKEVVLAQAKMNENMRLLQDRGIKIDEAADKAQQLNENAHEYADLARQLKEKTKKQAAWNPFGKK